MRCHRSPAARRRARPHGTADPRVARAAVVKWAVDVLLALGDGTRRYHQLLADLEPISEKVLTQTLRAMERDGLVGRRVHPEVPPRVEYALTPLGATRRAAARARRVVGRARQARRGGARPVRGAGAGEKAAAWQPRLPEQVVLGWPDELRGP